VTTTNQSLQSGLQLSNGTVVLVGLGGVIATSRDDGRHFTSRTELKRNGFAGLAEAPKERLLLVGEAGVRAVDLGE
jgi:photosystem II stability/assembly factor-like uncharacterized protein